MFDITVIGAGVVGAVIAEALSKYELSLCILDKENDVAMGATRANSAIVHAGFDAKEGSLKARFNVRGAELMPALAARLGVKYINNGSLVVAFESERAEVEKIYQRGLRNGVKGLSILEREELFALEPNLNPELSLALYAETGAIICPYDLCISAVGNAMDNGAELKLNFKVTDIEKTPTGYKITSEKGESIESKIVINSAGVYSDEIAALTGDGDFKITPRKGEYMLLDKECGSFVKHTIFHTPTKMGKGVLVSPTVDGNLLLGPTAVDIEDKADTSVTAEGFAQIFDKTADNASGVPFGKVITSFSGLRATGSTGDFIVKERDGIITLGGIESPGLSASPAIAEYVESMIKTGIGVDLKPKNDYCDTRRPTHWFRALTNEEKNDVIKENPAFGRIVCRCETVTEGEIVDAIHRNPPARDLDAVKRRTRSGMGRCQGGFCTPTVTEIITRETGISPEEVTKFGGESRLNLEKTKGGTV